MYQKLRGQNILLNVGEKKCAVVFLQCCSRYYGKTAFYSGIKVLKKKYRKLVYFLIKSFIVVNTVTNIPAMA